MVEYYNTMLKRVDEKELVQRIIQKDEKALLFLYQKYQKSIQHFIYRKLKDYNVAEEISQDVFLDFIEGLKTFLIDDELEKKELSTKIKKTLEMLPNDYRVILRLKYIDGERVNNIAEKLSIGFKATESLLFRARKAFIKIFQTLS